MNMHAIILIYLCFTCNYIYIYLGISKCFRTES